MYLVLSAFHVCSMNIKQYNENREDDGYRSRDTDCQVAGATEFFTVAPNVYLHPYIYMVTCLQVLITELVSCYDSGTYNVGEPVTFLENLCTCCQMTDQAMGWKVRGLNPDRGTSFFFIQIVQTACETWPASYFMGWKCEDNHSHLPSANFKNEWSLNYNLLRAVMVWIGTSPPPPPHPFIIQIVFYPNY